MNGFAELNEHFREALLETVPCSVFIVNENMEIIFWNRSAEELTGYTSREMVGQKCSRVHLTLCVGNETQLADLCPLAGTETAGEIECEIQRKDGGIIPVIRRSKPVFDSQGNPIGAIEALVDVSLIKSARNEIRLLKHQIADTGQYGSLIGSSQAIRRVYQLIEMVAETDANVVIEGETGTGKELVARTIHEESMRAPERFLPVNCGAIPEALLEAELFGHKKGAFTGAVADRAGCFEIATGGTLFLDEISELPLSSQVKLLRVLQESEITRVGDQLPRKVDVRIIAATNRELDRLVQKGHFRQDLYYRLQVVGVKVPPLRERKTDITALVHHFIEQFRKQYKRDLGITAEAMRALIDYDWPGNIRQLQHAIEHAFVVVPRDHQGIDAVDLPPEVSGLKSGNRLVNGTREKQDEKEQVLEALKQAEGNKSKAARLLGLTRAGFYKKLKRLGV